MSAANVVTPSRPATSVALARPTLVAGLIGATAVMAVLGFGGGARPRSVSWYPTAAIGFPRGDPVGLAKSIVVTILVLAVVAWSAKVVNSTIEEDPERFRALGRRMLGGRPRAGSGGRAQPVGLLGCCGAVALLALLAAHRPLASFQYLVVGTEGVAATVALHVVSAMIATFAVLFVFTEVIERADRSRTGERVDFAVVGWTLLVAVGLTVASWLFRANPPFVYALVAGYWRPATGDGGADGGRDSAPARAVSGMAVLVAASVLLGLCLVAAAATSVLGLPNGATDAGLLGLWARLADETVAATVTVGTQALVFGLMPFGFLHGSRLYRWRRGAWAGAHGLCLWLFLVGPAMAGVAAAPGGGPAAGAVGVALPGFGVVPLACSTLPAPGRDGLLGDRVGADRRRCTSSGRTSGH